jgi:hypothetical protein
MSLESRDQELMKFVGAIDENHTISTKQVINTIKQVHAEFHENSVSI